MIANLPSTPINSEVLLIKVANRDYDMGIVEIISNKHISGENAKRIFPTNKERLKHLDRRRA
jgi:hypothetical protein